MKIVEILKVATCDVKVISVSDKFETFVQYYDDASLRHYFNSKEDAKNCEYAETLKLKIGNIKIKNNMIVVWVN